MIVAFFVALVYLVPGLLLAGAREPILVRGERFAVAVLVFGGLDALRIVFGTAPWTIGGVVFWVLHLALLPLVRRRWVFWGLDLDGAATMLESRMRMLMLRFEVAAGGYSLPSAGEFCRLELTPLGRRSTILVIGCGRARKKVRLLRALIPKALRPVYPRPVISMGKRNHVSS